MKIQFVASLGASLENLSADMSAILEVNFKMNQTDYEHKYIYNIIHNNLNINVIYLMTISFCSTYLTISIHSVFSNHLMIKDRSLYIIT